MMMATRSNLLMFAAGFVAGSSLVSVQTMMDYHATTAVQIQAQDTHVTLPVSAASTTAATTATTSRHGHQQKEENLKKHQEEPPPPNQRQLVPSSTTTTILPEQNLVAGMGRVSRSEFAKQFDIGYALDKENSENNQVLILYQSESSLPTSSSTTTTPTTNTSADDSSSVQDAIENCQVVKVVVTDPKPIAPKNRFEREHKQCIAIMGQWESRHVHRFERPRGWKKQKEAVHHHSFDYIPAHHSADVPSPEITAASQTALVEYLSVLADAQAQLIPLAEKVAAANSNDGNGPIIVMVANAGQAQFFVNFVCTATHRNLDLSRVLLFATDLETHQLAQSMNVTSFYNEKVFGSIPSGAAVDYHDPNYGRIMMSKVYAVHLVNSLGYDLLFQDVDIVWYQNPLPYFTSAAVDPDFDMYFQHDGPHHEERFAPLGANTGLYYVRHNAKTQHLFSVFVRMGDLVLADQSHQAALTTLVNEHMSLRGLRVKVLAKDSKLFLSGYHYHARRQLFRKIKQGRHNPILFHVNWSKGKDKQPLLEETENWFVQEQCTEPTKLAAADLKQQGGFIETCCRRESLIPIKAAS